MRKEKNFRSYFPYFKKNVFSTLCFSNELVWEDWNEKSIYNNTNFSLICDSNYDIGVGKNYVKLSMPCPTLNIN